MHGTCCHSVLGYEALKHPLFGKEVRDMDLRQASRFAACAAGGCVLPCEWEAFTGGCGLMSAASIIVPVLTKKIRHVQIATMVGFLICPPKKSEDQPLADVSSRRG